MDFPKATRYGLGFAVKIRCLNILIKTYQFDNLFK